MNGNKLNEVQQAFLKYTAQMIIKDLRNNHPKVLEHFFVVAADRKYQIWERNPLSIEIHSLEVMLQKLNYIHHNLVKAGYVYWHKIIIIHRHYCILKVKFNGIF